jgi:hypothetical protein
VLYPKHHGCHSQPSPCLFWDLTVVNAFQITLPNFFSPLEETTMPTQLSSIQDHKFCWCLNQKAYEWGTKTEQGSEGSYKERKGREESNKEKNAKQLILIDCLVYGRPSDTSYFV